MTVKAFSLLRSYSFLTAARDRRNDRLNASPPSMSYRNHYVPPRDENARSVTGNISATTRTLGGVSNDRAGRTRTSASHAKRL
jgi:hypothetical protein